MLLKFAGTKRQYGIGLRWAVDNRSGIESIQFNTDLHYGIMLDIPEKINRKLKLVALCDSSHNKAICLSGLLASKYQSLILVHRISDSAYWACIIKNNSVWSGVDVSKATAGDYVGDYLSVQAVIEAAKTEFTAEGIDLTNILLASETASQDYSDFSVIDLSEFVTKIKQSSQYVIRYLQPSKILFRKIILLVVVVIAAAIAAYYIQQQRLVTRLLHQQQIEEEKQKVLAAQMKVNYFEKIKNSLHHQAGSVVVQNILTLLNLVPLESQGWNLVSANYSAQAPRTLELELARSEYGTLNSFLYAYSNTLENGQIASDNNSGIKQFTVKNMPLAEGSSTVSEEMLTQSIPEQSYRLISYMQANIALYNFKLNQRSVSQYQVNSTSFEIHGDKLWKLMQLKEALSSFTTLVINKIKFTVVSYDMDWTIEGVIYA